MNIGKLGVWWLPSDVKVDKHYFRIGQYVYATWFQVGRLAVGWM